MDIVDIIILLLILKIKKKTTFTCPFGTYAYKRMPFGLCNAPATFQRFMLCIFSNYVEIKIEVFIDDFMVYGDSFYKCLENLSLVLKRYIEINLVLNNEKVLFYSRTRNSYWAYCFFAWIRGC
jgi:hypothetical protein